MKTRLYLAFILLLGVLHYSFSQELKGKVTDQKGNPLIGASVIHLGSKHHAHTNQIGQFTLPEMVAGDSIQITYIGYETLLMKVDALSEYLAVRLSEVNLELSEVTVGGGTDPLQVISRIDIDLNPVNTSQEILRKVPGLFIGQHAGGGKAEQIFLRGFDIDHGTDVNLTVDGIPVNMVSHAHGQGYSDLHWLIPETIEKIDYGKGPYNTEKGNFATAGYVNFATKKTLSENSVKFEGGRFGTFRTVGMFSLIDQDRTNAYIATEYMNSDGPFESSQYFNRFNVMGKLNTSFLNGDMMSLTISNFRSSWDASGQIPDRAVESGQIGRFGALDDTEGGNTGRTNIGLNYSKILNDHTFIKNNTYYSLYDFELFSNFTFFLDDPVNGDQIRQQEQRRIFGSETTLNHGTEVFDVHTHVQIGAGIRNDVVENVGLANTINRDSLQSNIQLGDVNETNYYGFLDLEFELGNLTINPGVRYDYFQFIYEDGLIPAYNPESLQKGTVSPKLNFIYNFTKDFQLFLKSGVGFHSNDTRLVLERNSNRSILPSAFGADFGTVWKPAPRMLINAALWYLLSEQEFVYVGDAGIVEPSGTSRRRGVDLSVRYQMSSRLFFNADVNYAHARSIDDPVGEDFIPLAPSLTSMGGISYQGDVFSFSVNGRYLRDRAANGDESVIAEGYTIFDVNASYQFKRVTMGLMIENLFNEEWKETQFDTESRIRLADGTLESSPVSEIHFTPGTPFNMRLSLKYNF